MSLTCRVFVLYLSCNCVVNIKLVWHKLTSLVKQIRLSFPMSFKKRLLDLQFRFSLNGRSFAKHLGYKDPEKIQRLTRDEKNKPSFQILQDILNAFPNLNARWLMTGAGEMFGEEIAEINITGGQTMFSDNITQKGKGNVMQQTGASEELEALQKELVHKNDTIELLKKENEEKNKIINKLLDK